MRILWFTWKDKKNPLSGGAEMVNEELAKRLVKDGHEVIFLVGGFKGAKKKEKVDGYTVIRIGNKFTVYLEAFRYYSKNLKGWADLIIEEINTFPFMTQWYTKEKRILLIYQLCREIWFYQFLFPLNFIGYFIEPWYLWLLRNNKVLTESESTKEDLLKHGFKKANINIFPIGIEMGAIKNLSKVKKYSNFTLLSLGSIRPMKKTADQIKSFELAKKKLPGIHMKIAGDADNLYGKKVLDSIKKNPYSKDIEYLGKVNLNMKKELMQKSHVILVTSVKEGWGLIVTEANSQGTPAIVYNADGLKDSVKNNKTGIITKEKRPQSLAASIIRLNSNHNVYKNLQKNALELSREMTFKKSYKKFISYLK